jgi:FKBP-type peptidyl-prolyl cis-trans isomerase SlyD
MMGMEEGERRTIEVKPEEGYGEVDPELIQKIPREYSEGANPRWTDNRSKSGGF